MCKKCFKICMTAFVMIAFLALCSMSPAFSQEQPEDDPLVVPGVILEDADGNEVDLSGYVGQRPVVIWITDMCSVCAEGADNFNAVYENFNEDVGFFVISTSTPEHAKSFINTFGIRATTLMGGSDPVTEVLVGETGRFLCPIDNLFIAGKDGRVVFREHIPGTSTTELEGLVNQVVQ